MSTTQHSTRLYASSDNSIDTEEKDYLFIRPSQIPQSGKGLFTAIPIYKDEIICVFRGEILSKEESKIRSANNATGYFIKMIDGSIMDSINTDCYAKYANDAEGLSFNKFKNNAFISLNENDQVCIIANKNIASGKEIFCAYGKKYWKNFKKMNALLKNKN